MDRSDLEDWLTRYRTAWKSDDPEQIAALFVSDATYSPWPFSSAWEGQPQIVRKWIERGDSNREWEARDPRLRGRHGRGPGSDHLPARGDEPAGVYSNIWLIRLNPDGRAREFAEWWIEKPSETARG